MIRKVVVSNFRSLGEGVCLRLGAITGLVGPNGSGKSNALDSLRFIADCMRVGLEGAITKRHGIAAVRRWSKGRPYNLAIQVDVEAATLAAKYEFVLAGDRLEEYQVKREVAHLTVLTGENAGQTSEYRIERGKWEAGPSDLRPEVDGVSLVLPLIGGDRRFRPLADILRNVAVYSVFPDVLREPQKYEPTRPMHEHGTNWISILKDRDQVTWKPELLAALGNLTGDVEDIRIQPAGGYLVVQFKHRSEGQRAKWFDASQESDGTLRVAGIISALLQDPPLPIIGIEEPELTVHPGAIPLLHDFLLQASTRSQVVFTTHSPDLLDLLDPDDVRVVTRANGETRIAGMEPSQREAVRRGLLSLGEVMRTEGLQPGLFDTTLV